MKGEIVLIGIGNGTNELTLQAIDELRSAELILGFEGFVNSLRQYYSKTAKIVYDEDLRLGQYNEKVMHQRANLAVDHALLGEKVVLLYGGDLGVYTPAFYIFAYAKDRNFNNIRCVPGISFFISAAAELGCPLSHGFALTALFDRRTPEDIVLKRIKNAAKGDFVLIIYVPVPEATIFPEMYPPEQYPNIYPIEKKSKSRFTKMFNILTQFYKADTLVGILKYHTSDELRETILKTDVNDMKEKIYVIELKDLLNEYSQIDFFTTLIIGNSDTKKVGNFMITTFPDGKIYNGPIEIDS